MSKSVMVPGLNPSSPAAKKVLTTLDATKVGEFIDLDFGSLCPAFGEPCKGKLVEAHYNGKYYEIEVSWFGIPFVTLTTKITGNKLYLEEK